MGGGVMGAVSGGIGMLILVCFIFAIQISYAIEKATKPPARFPRYTNIWGTTLGIGVNRDDTATMALVARLRRLMLIVAALFVCLGMIAMLSS
jgi:hypothetical protein